MNICHQQKCAHVRCDVIDIYSDVNILTASYECSFENVYIKSVEDCSTLAHSGKKDFTNSTLKLLFLRCEVEDCAFPK